MCRGRNLALDPLVAAGTEPVVVVAAHLAAVPIEVDANRPAPSAARTRTAMAVRREVGLVEETARLTRRQ